MEKSKIITYVAVAVLVLAGLYWAYQRFNQTPIEPTGGVTAITATGAVVAPSDQTSQFVSVLNDIDNIKLDNQLIFNNKIFTSLKDFGRVIADRAIGRANPFSPFVGGTGIVGATVTGSSTDQ